MLGYGLSAAAKPPLGLVGAWPMALGLRFLDRVGKGIRTSPRDALIAQVTPPEIRGRAYGVHRAMDHAGAVVGPLIGAGLIAAWSVTDRQLFLLAGNSAPVTDSSCCR
jgi:MFS family permease